MRTLLLFTIILSSYSLSAQSLKTLNWLYGTWERENTKAGQTAFEVWEKPAMEELKGLGVTLKEADTVFMEKLSIVTKDQKLYYVAEVSQNAEPTFFEMTSTSKKGFVCENPEHDFPKKIEYMLQGDKLKVTISGDGKEIPFFFRRK